MSTIEAFLAFISFMLLIIWMYIRWIYLKIEYGKGFDLNAPVNSYGENFPTAIQEAIVRGQRGISSYDR